MSRIRTHNNRRRAKQRIAAQWPAALWSGEWERPALLPDWYARMQHPCNPEQDHFA